MRVVFLLIIGFGSGFSWAQDVVYVCRKDGKVLYSSITKDGYDCRELALDVIRPSQEEVERHRRDMAEREVQLLEVEEANRIQREIEAEEEAAREARRQAEAEQAQARYLEELRRFDEEQRAARYRSRYFYLDRMPPPLPPDQW